MNLDNIDISQVMDNMQNAIEENHEQIASGIISEQEYKGMLEDCVFETRDILRKMQEDSDKETKYNHCANVIIITIAVLTLIATVASIVISLLQ